MYGINTAFLGAVLTMAFNPYHVLGDGKIFAGLFEYARASSSHVCTEDSLAFCCHMAGDKFKPVTVQVIPVEDFRSSDKIKSFIV